MRTQTMLIITGLFLAVSCSNLVKNTRESLLGGNKPRKSTKQEVKWVSKAQYDDLMAKYKTLNQKYESLKENKAPPMGSPNMADETIDVFAQTEKKAMAPTPAASSNTEASGVAIEVSQIDEEIDYYKRARLMLKAGKVDEALKLFQFLEKAKRKQIQVR